MKVVLELSVTDRNHVASVLDKYANAVSSAARQSRSVSLSAARMMKAEELLLANLAAFIRAAPTVNGDPPKVPDTRKEYK